MLYLTISVSSTTERCIDNGISMSPDNVQNRGSHFRDIPDRWKRYDPDHPPYRVWPNRSRSQTRWASLISICTTFVGVFLTSKWYLSDDQRTDQNKNSAHGIMLTTAQKRDVAAQYEGLRRARVEGIRKATGEPKRYIGSCEIRHDL